MDNQSKEGRQLTKQEQERQLMGYQLLEMVNSKGWGLFRDFLDNKIKQDFVDPQSFTDDAAELTAHRKLAMMKKIALEMLDLVDMQIEEAKQLTKIEKGTGEAVKRI